MTEPAVLLGLVLALQVKHLVADFVLQSQYILANRYRYGHPGGLLHVAIHAAGSLAVLAVAGIAPPLLAALLLGEALLHYHLDWAKDNLVRRRALDPAGRGYWIALGVDQAAHQATYLGMVWIVAV